MKHRALLFLLLAIFACIMALFANLTANTNEENELNYRRDV